MIRNESPDSTSETSQERLSSKPDWRKPTKGCGEPPTSAQASLAWPAGLSLTSEGRLWHEYRVECAACSEQTDYPDADTYEIAEDLMQAEGWKRVLSPEPEWPDQTVWVCPVCWKQVHPGTEEIVQE